MFELECDCDHVIKPLVEAEMKKKVKVSSDCTIRLDLVGGQGEIA